MTTTQQAGAQRRVTPRQRSWLEGELAAWQAEGLVDAPRAAAIRDRYVVDRRGSLSRLVLGLGTVFLGIGVLWLVASNLDRVPPLVRTGAVAVLWLVAVASAEVLDRRRSPQEAPDVEVSVLRLLAALLWGGVVFSAAQALQVPAYEPSLLAVWAVGALGLAYAAGAAGPLVVGLASGVGWYAWAVGEAAETVEAVAVALLAGGVFAAAAAAAHVRGPLLTFASTWRQSAALLLLAGLFVVALPGVGGFDDDTPDGTGGGVPWRLVVGGLLAAVLAVAASARTDRTGRGEALVALAAAAGGVLLALWGTGTDAFSGELSGAALARALVATALYVAVAAWFVVLGELRDTARLTGLATAALVLFVTVQSFAVFAPLLSGAALFLALGVVLVGGGLLVRSGQRRLTAEVEERR